MPLKS